MDALAAGHDSAVQMIDTSLVRVHQHGTCIVDNSHQDMPFARRPDRQNLRGREHQEALPVYLAVTPGEAHDNRLCSALLGALVPKTMLPADRGYETDRIRELARQQGAWTNIPPNGA